MIELKNKLQINRKHYNGIHYTIDKNNLRIILNKDFYNDNLNKFKKLGGSSFGAVLGNNPFASKFIESMRILGISEPMYDMKYVNAGIDIEPQIINWISKAMGAKATGYDARAHQFDYFKMQGTKFEGFGGLPDATVNIDGEDIIFEIKTTGKKKIKIWEKNGVPPYYVSQLQTYMSMWTVKHGRRPKMGVLVTCFLEDDDYVNSKNVDILKREIRYWEIPYDEDMENKIIDALAWRQAIIDSGKSEMWMPFSQVDKEFLEFLECKNEEEFKEYLVKKGIA